MAPRVSVVVPVWNNRGLTLSCIGSLRRIPSKTAFRLVVVDNGSEDGIERDLAEMASRDELTLVRNATNLGYAKATNQGVLAGAGEEFVLFLNNDTLALDGWLDGLVADLDAHPSAAVAGSLLLYEDARTIQHAGMVAGRNQGELKVVHRWQFRDLDRAPEALEPAGVDAVTGASMLVRRSAFERCGLLSEDYVNGFEDIDFCFRVRSAGAEIRYAPASRLIHLESRTPGRRVHESGNARLFQARWGSATFPDTRGFALALQETRLRKRLERDPADGAALRKLSELVAPRGDGESAELAARYAALPWRRRFAARLGR